MSNRDFIDHQNRGIQNMSNAQSPLSADQIVVASKEPALNKFGQNGYLGPSSDEPGKHTTSGFLPKVAIPDDNWQTRPASAEQADPTTFSMRDRNATPAKIAPKTDRGGK
jgi:hypothetical protein